MPPDPAGLIRVRTTIEPHREQHVTPAEHTDLRRAGLLLDDSTPRPEDLDAAPAGRRARPTPTTADKATSKEG